MKTKGSIIIYPLLMVAMLLIFSGCFAPMNLTYESARTLEKGSVDAQCNYSRYYVDGNSINYNYGIKVGFGLTDYYNLKLRYERLNMNYNDSHSSSSGSINIIEIENKIKFKNANIAVGLPLSCYFSDLDGSLFIADPRMYFTVFGNSDKFELTFIPKAHVWLTGGLAVEPGLSIGVGLSNNLKKWALRPEIGYDSYFSFGIGLNVNLHKADKIELPLSEPE